MIDPRGWVLKNSEPNFKNSLLGINSNTLKGAEHTEDAEDTKPTESNTEPPFPMPPLIWKLAQARGFHSEEALKDLFSPSLNRLTSPFKLDQMDVAVNRLIQAYESQETICLYADFDMDGTPGLALLKEGLELLGFTKIIHYQPRRLTEGYGFHSHTLPQFKSQGVSLIITIDVGITDLETVIEAKKLQIDVIITDHHQPKDTLPQAVAVVNPNKKECSSQLGHLCGAGVAFYLILALRSQMRSKGLLTPESNFDPKVLLDCLAIATVTDMVPIIEENYILVKYGLKQLSKTKRPGLRALLKSLDLEKRPLTSQDIGFGIAPKLNALSRMEEGIRSLDMFLVESEQEAQQLTEQVLEINKQRVLSQRQAEAKARTTCTVGRDYIWVWSEDFHPGIIGLVASKLTDEFGVASFVGTQKADGRIVGSARSPSKKVSVLQALYAAKNVLTRFGGHTAAAGFEVATSQAKELDEAFQQYFSSLSPEELAPPQLTYDLNCSLKDLNLEFLKWYDALGPFGMDFEAPLFRLRNIQLKSHKVLNGGHYKLGLSKDQTHVDGLWFFPHAQHDFFKTETSLIHEIDLLVEPQANWFRGRKTLQLLIKDLKVVSLH